MNFILLLNMDILDQIENAISSQNVALLKELLQNDSVMDEAWDCFNFFEARAYETGNAEVVKVILEHWRFQFQVPIDRALDDVFYKFEELDNNEDKKLELLQYLMPHIRSQSSNPAGECFNLIIRFCTKKNFILVEYFINELYSENNSLYPLIKKHEAAVDGWHYIGVLLHDDIYLDFIQLQQHIKNFAETFLDLLIKDTRESMKLAVETFQVLFDKEIDQVLRDLIRFGRRSDEIWIKDYPQIEQALSDPLVRKLLFQFIYNSMNDKTQKKIEDIIFSMLETVSVDPELFQTFNLFIQLLKPFTSKSIWNISANLKRLFRENLERNSICSLKEFAGNVVKRQVSKNVKNVKEFLNRIWELKLPVTVKCFLLHIPDPSWMNDLQM